MEIPDQQTSIEIKCADPAEPSVSEQVATVETKVADHSVTVPTNYWAQRAVEHGAWAMAVRLLGFIMIMMCGVTVFDFLHMETSLWFFVLVLLPLPFGSINGKHEAQIAGENATTVEISCTQAKQLEDTRKLKIVFVALIALCIPIVVLDITRECLWLVLGLFVTGTAWTSFTARRNAKQWKQVLRTAIAEGERNDDGMAILINYGWPLDPKRHRD